MKINFITNQPLDRESGGWCGLSRGVFQALSKSAEMQFIGPIDPEPIFKEKVASKLLRSIGLQSNFHFFSKNRLQRISRQVRNLDCPADFDLYFGATPWLYCSSKRPYGSYIDALFPSYLRVFGNPGEFQKTDLNRIQQEEQEWLRSSHHIFWTSDWAREDGSQYEDLTGVPSSVIGIGGNFSPPEKDSYSGGHRLLFVSMRFEEKGGIEAFQAFSRLWRKLPDLTLVVIGDQPSTHVLEHPGVEYLGFLDKSKPSSLDRFVDELSRAFCLIHPTRMDTMGHIIIEAGYWGCPSIAPARFGIPEIIENGVTGLLLPDPFTVDDIVGHVEFLLRNKDHYLRMRAAARSHALATFTYDVIAEKILNTIEHSLGA